MPPAKKLLTRRRFLGGLTLAGLGGAAYVHWGEPHWLAVGRHEVAVSKTPKKSPLRILQMSDFHSSSFVSLGHIAHAVRLALSLQPDLICLTGDFVTASDSQVEGLAKTLAPLAQSAPTFACLGNHDGGWWTKFHGGFTDTQVIEAMLKEAGVTLLHNARRDISVRDWRLTLAGVGDLWSAAMNPGAAFAPPLASDSEATVLMSHNPDTKTALKYFPWDLLLCGHTHGGQFRLPFIGTPFAPVQDKKFVQGLHRWEGRWVHITRGVGNLHGLRFNCRPEVSLLSLV
jgi:predicted MPP superfamily phosphohydrolase